MGGQCAYDTAPAKSALKKLEDKARELQDAVDRLSLTRKFDRLSVSPDPSSSSASSSDADSPSEFPYKPFDSPAPYVGWVFSSPIIVDSSTFNPSSPQLIEYPSPDPLDTPPSLRDPLIFFLKQEVLPSHIRKHLYAHFPPSLCIPSHNFARRIDVFLSHRWHYATDFNVPRFLAAVEIPPSHPGCVHPALIDAMCLLGCMHAQESFAKYEALFLRRINNSLDQALHNADRLFDFLRASSLLGCYYYVKAR